MEDYAADWVRVLDRPLHRRAPLKLADVLDNGMLVARESLVLVDGARCYLPLPELGGMTVTPWNYAFAKLIDALSLQTGVAGGVGDPDRSDFDDYFKRAGLVLG